jgi:hypothetical protein
VLLRGHPPGVRRHRRLLGRLARRRCQVLARVVADDLDGGQVDVEQLRAPLQRRRDRPAQVCVMLGPHRGSLPNTRSEHEGSVSDRPDRPDNRLTWTPQQMPQPEHEPTAAGQPPRADGEVVAAAVPLLEAAALTAAMRGVASWNPHLHLSAAADRRWAPSAGGGQGSWRTDPSKQAAEFRLAVLVAEATIGRRLAEDGYLSARQLSVDLRHAAAWLAGGAQFGG